MSQILQKNQKRRILEKLTDNLLGRPTRGVHGVVSGIKEVLSVYKNYAKEWDSLSTKKDGGGGPGDMRKTGLYRLGQNPDLGKISDLGGLADNKQKDFGSTFNPINKPKWGSPRPVRPERPGPKRPGPLLEDGIHPMPGPPQPKPIGPMPKPSPWNPPGRPMPQPRPPQYPSPWNPPGRPMPQPRPQPYPGRPYPYPPQPKPQPYPEKPYPGKPYPYPPQPKPQPSPWNPPGMPRPRPIQPVQPVQPIQQPGLQPDPNQQPPRWNPQPWPIQPTQPNPYLRDPAARAKIDLYRKARQGQQPIEQPQPEVDWRGAPNGTSAPMGQLPKGSTGWFWDSNGNTWAPNYMSEPMFGTENLWDGGGSYGNQSQYPQLQ